MKDISETHLPVLRGEVTEIISPFPGGKYLDGTLGLGGHALALLQACPEIEICGLDRDVQALSMARERLLPYGNRVHFFHSRFSRFSEALTELGLGKINGALLDLGVSSLQLDSAERGFSFRKNGPLDMRMNQLDPGKTAADFVNRSSFEELKQIFQIYGEDPQAAKIARTIVEARQKTPLEDTLTLAGLVRASYPRSWRHNSRNHPATRAFQGLRIAVNSEVEELRSFLEQILPWLAPGGKLAIISFHSIEDRIVKNTFREWAKGGAGGCGAPCVKPLFKKPLVPSIGEEEENPRARSAKLRAVEKL